MPRRYDFGRAEEATHPDSIRATLSEFLSTFIFVFAAEGSVLSLGICHVQKYFILILLGIYDYIYSSLQP